MLMFMADGSLFCRFSRPALWHTDAVGAVHPIFATLVTQALPASAAGKPIEIWFQDEARVGQKGSLEYIWAPVGSRPPMVRDNRHDSAYLFGAICHARKVGAAIIMPSVNAEAMSEHLKEISTQIALGAHAVVVCDGAGWHQSGGRLRVPHNITLLPLPPYAPELNPMENIWDYLRGNKLSKRVWNSYQEIVAACKDAWLFLLGDPKRIDTIAHRAWSWVNVRVGRQYGARGGATNLVSTHDDLGGHCALWTGLASVHCDLEPNFCTFGENSTSYQCIRFLGTTPVSLDLGLSGLSASPERWAAM